MDSEWRRKWGVTRVREVYLYDKHLATRCCSATPCYSGWYVGYILDLDPGHPLATDDEFREAVHSEADDMMIHTDPQGYFQCHAIDRFPPEDNRHLGVDDDATAWEARLEDHDGDENLARDEVRDEVREYYGGNPLW